MNFETYLNLLANVVLTLSVTAFIVLLYNSKGIVNKWPLIGSYLLRVSLVLMAVGGLGNCLMLSTPPSSEIILNVGMAGLFSWAAWFHNKLLKGR
jgi:hypothetical protein